MQNAAAYKGSLHYCIIALHTSQCKELPHVQIELLVIGIDVNKPVRRLASVYFRGSHMGAIRSPNWWLLFWPDQPQPITRPRLRSAVLLEVLGTNQVGLAWKVQGCPASVPGLELLDCLRSMYLISGVSGRLNKIQTINLCWNLAETVLSPVQACFRIRPKPYAHV